MIVDLLSGWLGLLVLVLAGACALAADVLRQRPAAAAGVHQGSRDRPVAWCTALALALAALGAVATLVRFAALP